MTSFTLLHNIHNEGKYKILQVHKVKKFICFNSIKNQRETWAFCFWTRFKSTQFNSTNNHNKISKITTLIFSQTTRYFCYVPSQHSNETSSFHVPISALFSILSWNKYLNYSINEKIVSLHIHNYYITCK